MTTYSTAHASSHTFSHIAGGWMATVPAGVRCQPVRDEPGKFYVDDWTWIDSPLRRVEAAAFGIRIDAANITVDGAQPDVTPAAPVAVEKPAAELWLEVSAVRFSKDHAETCNDDPLGAHGFGVYMRNPLALHLIDFTPDSINPGGKRVTLRECHLAAFRYAGALAGHMGADVRTTINAGPLSYPSRFAIVPQRDFNAADLADTGTNFDQCDEADATQWAVFECMVHPTGFPGVDDSELVEDYPSREAAQAAIDALERGEPLPTPVWPPKRDVLPAGMSFFVAAVSTDDGVEMSDVIWSDVEPNREALLRELSCYPQMSDADPEKVTFYGPFTVGGGAF